MDARLAERGKDYAVWRGYQGCAVYNRVGVCDADVRICSNQAGFGCDHAVNKEVKENLTEAMSGEGTCLETY
jgi:hypothetical protein